MFTKEESKKHREEFWIAFGKSFPHKWILYKTKVKGLAFKFHFNVDAALVSLDIDTDLERRIQLWDKLNALKSILRQEYLPDAVFEDFYPLENGKEISRIYVSLKDVSIHNKDSWRDTMEFLYRSMIQFEAFFTDYRVILED